MKFRITCGTNDEKTFCLDHFGDSKYFLVYEVDSETKDINFLEKIENNSLEEKMHGDPKKAKGISGILKDVKVLVAFAMGPNIVRMRKRFIPVISREKDIEKSLEKFKIHIPEIKIELEKEDGDKNIFYIE